MNILHSALLHIMKLINNQEHLINKKKINYQILIL